MNCFICSIRPTLTLGSISNAFVVSGCPHGGHPSRHSFIVTSQRKRILGFFLYFLTFAAGVYDMNLSLSQDPNLFSVMIVTDLACLLLAHRKIFWNNVNSKWKTKEMRVMLYAANYMKKFTNQSMNYKKLRDASYLAIVIIIFFNVIPGYYFLFNGITFNSLVQSFSRVAIGVLVSLTHLQSTVEFWLYGLFFLCIFKQIEREITSRLLELSQIRIAYLKPKSLTSNTASTLLVKIRKLKRLYLIVFRSFSRTKNSIRISISLTQLMFYFLLIILNLLTVMGVTGRFRFHKWHYVFLIKQALYVATGFAFNLTCDWIMNLVKDAQSVLFKVPLQVLNKEEKLEVESFINLISWEKPIDNGPGPVVYGKPFLANLFVEVIPNSMVLLQLYFWFTKA